MRRRPPTVDPDAVPAELHHRPATPQDIAAWIGPDGASREITAFYRWIDARRAWVAERGLNYADTFRPYEPVIAPAAKE